MEVNQKIVKRPSQPDQVTDYVGSYVYENSTLEFFFTAEGRAVPDASLGGQFRYEYYYTDHPGNSRLCYSDLNGDGKVTKTEIIQEAHYYPYGLELQGLGTPQIGNQHRWLFNGKEVEVDFGLAWQDFGARRYDAQVGRWCGVDLMAEKYSVLSPFVFGANTPINAIDSDGNDIIFIIDKEVVSGMGHIAVLIGSEEEGWRYVSINGTGEGASAWGENKNADLGTLITDLEGKLICDPFLAIDRANTINPLETHSYDFAKRMKTSIDEDEASLSKAKETASTKLYGVCLFGKSCIDVAQSAFATIVNRRNLDDKGEVPGENDLIPINWFDKVENRATIANENARNEEEKIEVISLLKQSQNPTLEK
ncbi:MAG: hypothetical protein H6581_24290 [Bacteroidia bacterium]|nr:hypothetical protein [Bacteroidia bacterium]